MKEDSWSSGHRKSIVLSSSNQNGSTVTVGLLCWAAAALPQHRNYSTQSGESQQLPKHLLMIIIHMVLKTARDNL